MIKNLFLVGVIGWFMWDMLNSFVTVDDIPLMLSILVIDILSVNVTLSMFGKYDFNPALNKLMNVIVLAWYCFYLPIDFVADNPLGWKIWYCAIDFMMIFISFIGFIKSYKTKEYKDVYSMLINSIGLMIALFIYSIRVGMIWN